MTSAAEKLVQALRLIAPNKKRLLLEHIWKAFADSQPGELSDDRRARLGNLLSELAGTLRPPQTRSLYDRTAAPALPLWVEWIEPLPVRSASALPPDIAWAPELRFACTLRHPEQIADCLIIQRFLTDGGAARPMVPIKERSIQLFGDEKKLDRLKDTILFGPDGLSLNHLRCFVVSAPLVFESGPEKARPLLVIENHSTYDSFCRWNAKRGEFTAIAYGAGDAFRSSVGFLPRIIEVSGAEPRVQYFGDLDYDGIRIPSQASRTAEKLGLPPIVSHARSYGRLIALARQDTLRAGEPWQLSDEFMNWLPPNVRPVAAELGRSGRRLAQEWLGYEALLE